MVFAIVREGVYFDLIKKSGLANELFNECKAIFEICMRQETQFIYRLIHLLLELRVRQVVEGG